MTFARSSRRSIVATRLRRLLSLPSVLALIGEPSVVLGGVLLPLLFHELGELTFLLEPLVPGSRAREGKERQVVLR